MFVALSAITALEGNGNGSSCSQGLQTVALILSADSPTIIQFLTFALAQ